MRAEGGILTGPAICEAVRAGDIVIDPWAPGQVSDHVEAWEQHRRVNSGSYDLRLGNKVSVYQNAVDLVHGGSRYVSYYEDLIHDVSRMKFTPPQYFDGTRLVPNGSYVIDSKAKQSVHTFEIDPMVGWVCYPGIGYLMHTQETIWTEKYIPVIDGKSSIGRLFTTTHVTAGYGDAGYRGHWTLEVVVTHPTRVYAGMRFCQMRFHTQVGEVLPYQGRGHYIGGTARGPVPSMAYKQFEEDDGK